MTEYKTFINSLINNETEENIRKYYGDYVKSIIDITGRVYYNRLDLIEHDYYKSILNKEHFTEDDKEVRIRNDIIITTRNRELFTPIIIYNLKHFKDLIYKAETVSRSMKLNMFSRRIVEYEDDTTISGCNVVKSIQIGKKRTECYYLCSGFEDRNVKEGMITLYRIKPQPKFIYKKNNKIVASVIEYDKTSTYKKPTYIHNSEITDGYHLDYNVNDGCFCILHI